jgi:replicative DNA helicase
MAEDLPYSESAEAAVLCSMMNSQDRQGDGIELLEERDFYTPKNRVVFGGIRNLYEMARPADAVTLAEFLSSSGDIEKAGGVEYVSHLLDVDYTDSGFPEYVSIVRNKAVQRRLAVAAKKILEQARATPHTEVRNLSDMAEKEIWEASQIKESDGPERIGNMVLPVMATIEARMEHKEIVTGLATGLVKLDQMTSGLHGGDLSIVAARPGMGKTSWAMQIALNSAVYEEVPAYVFELEMSKEQLMERLLSQLSGVPHHFIKHGNLSSVQLNSLAAAGNKLYKAPLFVDDNPSLNSTELRSKTRRLVKEHGKGMILVDYLQLMDIPGRGTRNEEVGKVSRAAKILAREVDCPLIMLSQLSRGPESREDKRPRLSDLRDSGSIEQDADNVFFVYRPELHYGRHGPGGEDLSGKAEIIVGKQRNGPVGLVKCQFQKSLMMFFDEEDT